MRVIHLIQKNFRGRFFKSPQRRKFAVVDCETTGLDPTARIIQLAVVFLDEDLQYEDQFVSYVRGDGTVGTEDAVKVHGITVDQICGAPSFLEILPKFETELRKRTVFAHFAPFDSEKLNYELALVGRPPLVGLGCTKELGNFLGYGVLRLSEATKLFGIDPGRPHDAGSDALSASSVLRNYFERHPTEFNQYLVTLD